MAENTHSLLSALKKRRDRSISITPDAERTKYPLSTAQQRLWFLHKAVPDSAAYNVPLAIHIVGTIDSNVIEECIVELMRRHDQLRAVFEFDDGEPVCVVGEMPEFRLDREELGGPEPRDWRSGLDSIRTFVRIPFDLESGPCFRAMLLDVNPGESVFVMSFHHIICEAWSLAILMRELGDLLDSKMRGAGATLDPLPVKFGDFAVWERAALANEDAQQGIRYWKKRLENLETLEVPTDFPRPNVQSLRGKLIGRQLDGKLIQGVRNFAADNQVTEFVTALAAMYCFLYKYTGQSSIAIGSPVSSRDQSEVQRVFGFFVNTILLHSDIDPERSILKLLSDVKSTVLEALTHKSVPFELLVDELQANRDLSRNPLFQVMFALQNTPLPELDLTGVSSAQVLRQDDVHTGTSRVDLSFVIEPVDESWVVWVEFNTDLFEAETIERMLLHYEQALRELVANPDMPVRDLSILTGAEYRQLTVDWNATAVDVPGSRIIDQFQAAVAANGSELAVTSQDRTIEYSALDRISDDIALQLQEMDIGPGSFVAVWLERSVELVASLLGILKSGAAYVPIDPDCPGERARFMIEDSGSAAIIALGDPDIDMSSVKCIEIGRFFATDRPVRALFQAPPHDPESTAYVIYTSGSTGKPKGVQISHRSLENLVHWHTRTYDLGPADVCTLIASPAFDASVWELWPGLAAGARFGIPDANTRLSPSQLVSWMVRTGVTVSFLPTPLAEAVLGETWPRDAALRALLTGGDLMHDLGNLDLPFGVFNHYGPTENTVVTTACEVNFADRGLPPIGRPIDNTETYILDRFEKPVPIGVTGELYVAGIGLAQSYVNNPELTAKSFMANPIGESRWKLAYRTGDLCRFRSDGSIQFETRSDTQVKIRGYRVELGEIESVLQSIPDIPEAAVAVRRDPRSGHDVLVAYVPTGIQTTTLRKKVASLLPQYMCPQFYVGVDEIPKTSNGKVDRRALPVPWSGGDDATSGGEPRTNVERELAALWTDVLGIDSVGLDDNFFEVGGNSLLAVKLAHRVEKQMNFRLNLLDLMSGSLGQTAASIERVVGSDAAAPKNQYLQHLLGIFRRRKNRGRNDSYDLE